MAGYSGTPLPKKLGIKDGHRLAVVSAPPTLDAALGELPTGVRRVDRLETRRRYDVILLFVRSRAQLEGALEKTAGFLEPNGGLWVCWPKKTSKLAGDVTEDPIRNGALSLGLVDNKVCAIDEDWSGLRVVWRLENRARVAAADPVQALEDALRASKTAWAAYSRLPPSHQREWQRYVAEAKKPQTRARRIAEVAVRIVDPD